MRSIKTYYPGSKFPSASVTGPTCSMSCSHCSGRYLKGMVDVSARGSLLDLGIRLWMNGGNGILISGGCNANGAVDFPVFIFDEIRKIKDETDLKINIHCGLADEKTADRISDSGVDKVSFDLVYDDETIRSVLRLERKKENYLETMDQLLERDIEISPHILAGLDHGKISWERNAVDILQTLPVKEVVLIVLIPTKGTDFESLDPPKEKEVIGLAQYMRDNLTSRLILGCMRPKRMIELEKEVIDLGFDGIVVPSIKTLDWIREKGWTAIKMDICCCF